MDGRGGGGGGGDGRISQAQTQAQRQGGSVMRRSWRRVVGDKVRAVRGSDHLGPWRPLSASAFTLSEMENCGRIWGEEEARSPLHFKEKSLALCWE